MDVAERGLFGSKLGTTDIISLKTKMENYNQYNNNYFQKYLVLFVVELLVLLMFTVGGGVELGVLFLLLNGELAGRDLEVTSILNKPVT